MFFFLLCSRSDGAEFIHIHKTGASSLRSFKCENAFCVGLRISFSSIQFCTVFFNFKFALFSFFVCFKIIYLLITFNYMKKQILGQSFVCLSNLIYLIICTRGLNQLLCVCCCRLFSSSLTKRKEKSRAHLSRLINCICFEYFTCVFAARSGAITQSQ